MSFVHGTWLLSVVVVFCNYFVSNEYRFEIANGRLFRFAAFVEGGCSLPSLSITISAHLLCVLHKGVFKSPSVRYLSANLHTQECG